MRTRFIAYLALFTSSITFGSGLLVFLYMKSPAFEDQLLGQVMKHMDWIVENEFKDKIQAIKTLMQISGMMDTDKRTESVAVFQGFTKEQLDAIGSGGVKQIAEANREVEV